MLLTLDNKRFTEIKRLFKLETKFFKTSHLLCRYQKMENFTPESDISYLY